MALRRIPLELLLPPLLFVAGTAFYMINGSARLVFWDEFFWYPEILRMARSTLPRLDIPAMIHPTTWQYPPLFFLVSGVAARLIDEQPIACRLVSILSSAALAPLAFLMARKLHGLPAGCMAGAIMLSLPLAHRFGSAVLVDPFQAALIALALYLLVRFLNEGTSPLSATLVTVLACSTKYTSFLFAAVVGVCILLTPGKRVSIRLRAVCLVLLALPLLFLRGEDIELLRLMTTWKSLPLDWSDLFTLVSPVLLVFVPAAAFTLRSSSRGMRAVWSAAALWLLFFFLRRQQMNWLLPAAVPMAVVAGCALSRIASGPGRFAGAAALLYLVAAGAIHSLDESGDYRERGAIYSEAGEWITERVPPDGMVAVDAFMFNNRLYVGAATIDVRQAAYNRSHFALLVPWVYENFSIGGFEGSGAGKMHEEEIRAKWKRERTFEMDDEVILEIYSNPIYRKRISGGE